MYGLTLSNDFIFLQSKYTIRTTFLNNFSVNFSAL